MSCLVEVKSSFEEDIEGTTATRPCHCYGSTDDVKFIRFGWFAELY